MIYCLNCGKGIPDQSKFCTFCGTTVALANMDTPNVIVPSSLEQATTSPVVESTTPPVTQQTAQPFVQQTQPPVTPQYMDMNVTRTASVVPQNQFYKNAGFWGAVLTLAGFFLPFLNGNDASFYYLVSDLAPAKPELYMYLVFPVSAAILIIQGLTGVLPKFLIVIFKILPLLMLILLVIGASESGSNLGFMGDDVGTILKNIGIGLYMTVIGTIFMLFFRTTKVKA